MVSPVPIPELENAVRGERDRVDASPLQLVVARDLGPDLLQVGLGIPVKLGAHVGSLTSKRVYAEGGIVDLERLALSSGQARALDLEVALDPIELGGQDYEPAGEGPMPASTCRGPARATPSASASPPS